nr:glycoside hydrolase family 5 subfamily 2 [Phymatodes testaceus]
MKYTLAIWLAVLCGCLFEAGFSLDAALETVSKHGKLSVSGTQLLNQQGEAVQLKGMSMFWSVWMPKYWNAPTVTSIHTQCHSNIVRAAMAVEYDGYLTNKETELARLETVVDAAIAEDIYVIIDWHDWHGEEHLQQAMEFFDYVSKKYASYPNIIYETYNEPLNISWSEVVKPYHLQIIQTIRANDPDNVILLGCPQWDQDLDQVAADPITGQTNIMYTMHFYAHQCRQWLRDRADNVLNQGIPIFVTEYGTVDGTGNGTVDADETQLWWTWLDGHQMSYVNWALSDKDESASALIADTTPEMACQDSTLTESGKLVIAQNKK